MSSNECSFGLDSAFESTIKYQDALERDDEQSDLQNSESLPVYNHNCNKELKVEEASTKPSFPVNKPSMEYKSINATWSEQELYEFWMENNEDGSSGGEEDHSVLDFRCETAEYVSEIISSSNYSFDKLSIEIQATILSYLSLDDIICCSLTSRSFLQASRSDQLWKFLFKYRWNVKDYFKERFCVTGVDTNRAQQKQQKWYRAYQEAHFHPHDLWITHWNCVYPDDCLSPGRCCIPQTKEKRRGSPNNRTRQKRPLDKYYCICPVCRCGESKSDNHDYSSDERGSLGEIIHEIPHTTTCAQRIALSTELYKRKRRKLYRTIENVVVDKCSRRDVNNVDPVADRFRKSCIDEGNSRCRRAFEEASTFHRRICSRQYESVFGTPATNFLSDLLFFNITDPGTYEGQVELQNLLKEEQDKVTWAELDTATTGSRGNRSVRQAIGRGNVNNNVQFNDNDMDMMENEEQKDSSLFWSTLYETTNHSWHVCKLCNPDFDRPIVFQFAIQRLDCFTVYPSQGVLNPGDSTFVTIGVRPLGSASAYGYEALNVYRDGLPVPWAEHYAEQAHLPMAPIIVRYHFCPPIHTVDNKSSFNNLAQDTTELKIQHRLPSRNSLPSNINVVTSMKDLKRRTIGHHLKFHPVPTQQMRTIYLSAHVNAHYRFSDFTKETLQPWDSFLYQSYDVPIYNSPILREEYFRPIYSSLQNLSIKSFTEDYNSDACDIIDDTKEKRTDSSEVCEYCRRSWNLRDEELFQALEVAEGEAIWNQMKRGIIIRNVAMCLRLMQESARADSSSVGLSGYPYQLSSLLYGIHVVLQEYKACPHFSLKQMATLLRMEIYVDQVYQQLTNIVNRTEELIDWIPWRRSGVFRNIICTDSVYEHETDVWKIIFPVSEVDNQTVHLKDEPYYLDAFRHLAHSPGRYCLGPQIDPNHTNDFSNVTISMYTRTQETSDLFMDDPISTFQAGICMIRDPRSLLVHGLFDIVVYPGAIVRRPKIDYNVVSTSTLDTPNSKPEYKPLEMGTFVTTNKMVYYRLQNGLDLSSIVDTSCIKGTHDYHTISLLGQSLHNFLVGLPPVGIGKYPLSQYRIPANRNNEIFPLSFERSSEREIKNGHIRWISHDRPSVSEAEAGVFQPEQEPPLVGRGPRLLRLLWLLGARVGLAVVDMPDMSSVHVERNILIASQWVSISFMCAPMFWTLIARYSCWIPSQPIEYTLENLPYTLSNRMFYLTEAQCGLVAFFLFFAWLALGRWNERYTSRDFFRVMQDHVSLLQVARREKVSLKQRITFWFALYAQRQWDKICPFFLQRRVFTPYWNRRKRNDLYKHIAFWRSRNLQEHRVAAKTNERKQDVIFGDRRDDGIDVDANSSLHKSIIGGFAAVASFCLSSPHFWLNVVTVFSCSISLGMSVSLHSMEKGRSFTDTDSTGSLLKAFSVVTIVIFACLVGQLVGSSGGTMFLAEFIVTSISLILGGAGTISASAMESWGCFFCLSSTAFWGYLFGRVALLDGIRKKRGGYASVLLSKAVLFLFVFWIFVFMISSWELPINMIITRLDENKLRNRTRMTQKLQ